MINLLKYSFYAGVVMMMVSPVFAQNINSVEARLDRMEREMNTLSRSVFRGDVPPPTMQVQNSGSSNTAAMELRLNQLEDQIRRMTGMIEENSFRLRKLETTGVSSQANTQPQQLNQFVPEPSIDNSPLVVDNSPYQLGTINNTGTSPAGLYDEAFGYLQVNDYASAQDSFERFIAAYPDHSLVANSKYWLGETFYARNDYQAASQSFARAFKDHPDGQKAPDTLLKLAMSLKAQDMNTEACLTLDELSKRFPNAPSSVTTKASEERASYGCDA